MLKQLLVKQTNKQQQQKIIIRNKVYYRNKEMKTDNKEILIPMLSGLWGRTGPLCSLGSAHIHPFSFVAFTKGIHTFRGEKKVRREERSEGERGGKEGKYC